MLVSGTLIADNITDTDDLISRFLDNKDTIVHNVARSSCNGTASVFRGSLSALDLIVDFPGNPVPLVRGLLIDGLSMLPNQDGSVAMQLNTTVMVNSPLGPNAPLVIDEI